MLNRIFVLILALGALSAAALAQGPAEPTGSSTPAAKSEKKAAVKEVSNDVSDETLERERSMMDARFAARVGAIKGDADRRAAYHALSEKRRFEFERHESEERKAFYLYLRSVAADERAGRLKEFDERQDRDRVKFDKDQYADAKNWFDDEIEKRWRSTSLLEQEIPQTVRVAGSSPASEAPAPKPKARRPAIVKKPKAKKRRSRVVHREAAPAPAQDAGAGDAGGAVDVNAVN